MSSPVLLVYLGMFSMAQATPLPPNPYDEATQPYWHGVRTSGPSASISANVCCKRFCCKLVDVLQGAGRTLGYALVVRMSECIQRKRRGMLSPKPPHNNEEPEDNNEEDYVPQPAASLPGGHVVHATERAFENARGLGERVVLRGPCIRQWGQVGEGV